MYLTYSEYVTLGGTLTEAAFNRIERKVEAYLNRMTHDRVKDETPVRECVKLTVFDLIGVTAEADTQSVPDGAVSVSNDGVSVSYGSAQARDRAVATRKNGILIDYLDGEVKDGVPLLYGGVQFDTVRQ